MTENGKDDAREHTSADDCGADNQRGPAHGDERGDGTTMGAPSPDRPGLKIRLEEKLGLLDDLRVVGYPGHGTDRALHVEGRLIEHKAEAGEPGGSGESGTSGASGDEASGGSGIWRNVKDSIRRLESDEIPGARIRARFGGGEWDVWTDNEGFFKVDVPLDAPLEAGWHDVELELVESLKEDHHPTGVASILVPSPDAEFAVISDLDDTVIKSSSADTIRKLRVVFAKDAASRAAFAGVAELYEALVEGPDARGINPIFYVSRSGWNLFDLFHQFLEDKGIPRGPIFLQDLAFRESKSRTVGHESHKRDRIRLLMEAYPDLPFVLIGDSGQEDPETYRQVVHEKPGRVRAIYIRDVTPDDRDAEVERIAEELSDRGVPTLLVATTAEAAEHAAEHGLITRAALQRVRDAAGDAPASETEV